MQAVFPKISNSNYSKMACITKHAALFQSPSKGN